MNPDLAQFREKLVRLRDQADMALHLIDAGMPLKHIPLMLEPGSRPGFSVGDFTVLDRFSTFTKGPEA